MQITSYYIYNIYIHISTLTGFCHPTVFQWNSLILMIFFLAHPRSSSGLESVDVFFGSPLCHLLFLQPALLEMVESWVVAWLSSKSGTEKKLYKLWPSNIINLPSGWILRNFTTLKQAQFWEVNSLILNYHLPGIFLSCDVAVKLDHHRQLLLSLFG